MLIANNINTRQFIIIIKKFLSEKLKTKTEITKISFTTCKWIELFCHEQISSPHLVYFQCLPVCYYLLHYYCFLVCPSHVHPN